MPRKLRYHHGNLKAALVTAALEEIARHGVEGFSLRKVAQRAGVSAPAVYRHFADKEDLIAAVAVDAQERLNALIAEALAAAPPEPLEQFRAVGVSFVRFAVAHPEHFRVISLPSAFARAPAEVRAQRDAIAAAQRRDLAEARARGQIADIPVEQLLGAAYALVNGLAHAIIAGWYGEVDDARATALAIEATDVLGIGLIPRAAPCAPPRP